ncbi:MAG: hypothetical protein IKL65_01140 [Bacilli bacterium]|nr:hypothetical protein [Bacilli bacterium]
MKKLKNSTVLALICIILNKQEITLEDFFLYLKKIIIYLKQYGYFVDKISEENIISFFSMFPYLGTMKKDKIILKQIKNNKINDFFFCDINKELIEDIKNNNKYVFPVINKDRLINYYFISNDTLLENIKDEFYYDSIKNNTYIIDLQTIKDKYNNIYPFLKNFLEKELIVKKESFNYKEVSECFDLYYSLILENDEFLSIYKTIFYYTHIAHSNKINLEPYEKSKKI